MGGQAGQEPKSAWVGPRGRQKEAWSKSNLQTQSVQDQGPPAPAGWSSRACSPSPRSRPYCSSINTCLTAVRPGHDHTMSLSLCDGFRVVPYLRCTLDLGFQPPHSCRIICLLGLQYFICRGSTSHKTFFFTVDPP